MQMWTHENTLEVVKILAADSELTDMLALNPPYYDEKVTTETRANSIVPMEDIPLLKRKPAVGVKAGVHSKVGTSLMDVIILIRCYNNMDKAYVEINKVLSKVEALVSGQDLTLTNMTTINTFFENISQESVDEAYQLRFRELQFRVQII